MRATDAGCEHPYAAIRHLEQEVQAERRRVLERADAELARARADACAREAGAEERGRRAAEEIRRRAEREMEQSAVAARAESAASLAAFARRAEVDREETLAAMLRLLVGDGSGGQG